MYAITSLTTSKEPIYLAYNKNEWYWTTNIKTAKQFDTRKDAEGICVYYYHVIPRTKNKISIEQIMFSCEKTLE